MATRLTREQLYALVWDRPVTKLAKDFGLSDVALHKICRKHNIPTPPLGYWAKKAHGKPVRSTPLPKDKERDDSDYIVIHEGAGTVESEAAAAARARVQAAVEQQQTDDVVDVAHDPILERTIAKLSKAKADRTGIVHVEGKGLISVSVRPESAGRAKLVLEMLIRTARTAGIKLEAQDGAAFWRAEGESVSFELVEAADRVEHIPTEAELKAVAKWEAKREADRKRYGYASDWGRPHIPKWEEQFQGRLAVRLEEVRVRTENEYWGPVIRRVFADSKTRDVLRMGPKIISTVAAIAVGKRENRQADERRRLAREEAERRRQEAERRAALERKRVATLDTLMAEQDQIARLADYLAALERSSNKGDIPARVDRLIGWVRARLKRMQQASMPVALDERLARDGAFETDVD
ncbi:hypothetical protein [Nitratireductor sp. GCM10026969]|uniref:hypothetical protein n=1 Tax=Nitratireductor sp. GCM10026969 TaxID=3252645 RepID=UPI0036111F00